MRSLEAFFSRIRPQQVVPVLNQQSDRVGILSNGENASLAYLLGPHLLSQGAITELIAAELAPPADIAALRCHTIVVVRYLPQRWVRFLRQFRAAGGRLIYFMDDDLMDTAAAVGLPVSYAKKIRKQATQRRAELERLCDEFWVASAYLAQKYCAWSPTLISPLPGLSYLRPEPATTICYHGTASHQAELEWLVPVIDAVQLRNNVTRFEVFGDHLVNRMFRNLQRISILHPMSWQNYLAYTAGVERDIALAPLLPLPFNAARGPTKFFDFVRMGAVGIYSDVAPYKGFIRDGIDGLLLPNEPELWVESVLKLASDESRRQSMADAARQRALSMAWDGGGRSETLRPNT